jgi:signal transduction histidine kinase
VPSLKTELLANVAILALGALVLAIASALLIPLVGNGWTGAALLAAIAVADVLILVAFGRYLVNNLVLRPVDRLVEVTEAVAAGDLARRAGDAGTQELDRLALSVNRMTERLLDAQGALIQAEKLASVGRLAAGIAHEVGNPLSAIGNYLEVLRRRGVEPEVLTAAGREVGRIDAIVRGLLAYARPREAHRELLALGDVAEGAVALLTAQGVLRDVEIGVTRDPATPPVAGDRVMLEQVVVNLLLNAVDAAGPGGRVAVGVAPAWPGRPSGEARRSLDHAALDDALSARRASRPVRFLDGAARAAQLVVADSGPGVPEELRGRVFDPFFTTKAPGHGTGLGLAIVQRIVGDHGGRVDVTSAREGGAAFLVLLPAAAEAA